MNFTYNNVYLNGVSSIAGPYEYDGPLSKNFDKVYKDFYLGEDTFEKAEIKMLKESINTLLNKVKLKKENIDTHISGDLLNQITASSYAESELGIPFIGVYAACATSVLGLAIGSNLVDSRQASNCITSVSSHNLTAERQFRYPVEYGGPKHKSSTFTCTGAVSFYLSNKKSNIKVESATIGTVTDLGITDVNDMGAVMAPAAARTLHDHLALNNRTVDYYDLILTGDLGSEGKKIFKEYINSEYGIKIKNYNDCGTILYDLENQEVYSGASGPACLPLVFASTIYKDMLKGKYKRVLLIATGALHSTTLVNQKLSIPSIAHAISLEVI